MSVGPKPVSSRSSRSAPAATRSSGSSEPETHCHSPGRIRPARSADRAGSRASDAARRPADPEHPAVDEVGAEGAHRAPPDGVQLLEVHQVVDAGEDQPLAAAQPPDERMVQRARIDLVPGDGPRRPLDDPLALGDLAQQRARGPHRRAPGTPRTTAARRPGSDRPRPCAAASARPARASQSCPIAWATFQSSSPPVAPRSASDRSPTIAASASASDAELRDDPLRRPGAGHAAGPRGGPSRT